MGSKVLGTLCFPFCLRENLVQAKTRAADDDDTHEPERHTDHKQAHKTHSEDTASCHTP